MYDYFVIKLKLEMETINEIFCESIPENENVISPAPDDLNANSSPEYLQRKLYFLLKHLKKMHSDLNE